MASSCLRTSLANSFSMIFPSGYRKTILTLSHLALVAGLHIFAISAHASTECAAIYGLPVESIFRLPEVTDSAFKRSPVFFSLLHTRFASVQLVFAVPLNGEEVLFENEKATEDTTSVGSVLLFYSFPIYNLAT